MNIQKIYNAQIYTAPIINAGNFAYPKFGVTMPKPLAYDTVSFHGKAPVVTKEVKAALARKEARAANYARLLADTKTAPTKKELTGDERTWGVSFATAQKIHGMVLKYQQQVHDFMYEVFGDVADESSSKRLILHISDRAKTPVSIMEKSATRKWNSVKEILENMTDLNGAKIVMNHKTGKEDVETILDRLIPLTKLGQVQLKEIELQRPEWIKSSAKKEQEEIDYVSKDFLNKLEDIQEQVINGLEDNPKKITLIERPLPKYTKGNYCALHLLLQINKKGSRPFELQIMGARMAKGKDFDDKRFKFFDGKQLNKKYDELTKLWEPLLEDENKAAKERFLTYCKDANFQLRLDELLEYKNQKKLTKPTGFFKSPRDYNLPPEYDLNEQYKLMKECEKITTQEKEKQPESHKLNIKVISRDSVKKIIKKFTPHKHNGSNS